MNITYIIQLYTHTHIQYNIWYSYEVKVMMINAFDRKVKIILKYIDNIIK